MENENLTIERLEAVKKAMIKIQWKDHSLNFKPFLAEVLKKIYRIKNRNSPAALSNEPTHWIIRPSKQDEQKQVYGKSLTLENLKPIQIAMNELTGGERPTHFNSYLIEVNREIEQLNNPVNDKLNQSKEYAEKQRLLDNLQLAKEEAQNHLWNCQTCKNYNNDRQKYPRCEKFRFLWNIVKKRNDDLLNGDDPKIVVL